MTFKKKIKESEEYFSVVFARKTDTKYVYGLFTVIVHDDIDP